MIGEWFSMDPVVVLAAPRELWLIRVAALRAGVAAHKRAEAKH